jgi:hypothetical protein
MTRLCASPSQGRCCNSRHRTFNFPRPQTWDPPHCLPHAPTQGDDVIWFATDVDGVRYILKDPRMEAVEGAQAAKLKSRQIWRHLVLVGARARGGWGINGRGPLPPRERASEGQGPADTAGGQPPVPAPAARAARSATLACSRRLTLHHSAPRPPCPPGHRVAGQRAHRPHGAQAAVPQLLRRRRAGHPPRGRRAVAEEPR